MADDEGGTNGQLLIGAGAGGQPEPVRLGDLNALRSIYYEVSLGLEGAFAGLGEEDVEKLREAVRPLLQGPKPDYVAARTKVSPDFPKYHAALEAIRLPLAEISRVAVGAVAVLAEPTADLAVVDSAAVAVAVAAVAAAAG